MQQAEALLELMREIRKAAPAVSFGMFTGYTESELATGQYVTRPGATRGAEAGTLAGGSGASGLRGHGPLRPDAADDGAATDEPESKARTVQRPLSRGRLRTATRRNQHRGEWEIRTHWISRARHSCLKRQTAGSEPNRARESRTYFQNEPEDTRRIVRVDACLSRSGPGVMSGIE